MQPLDQLQADLQSLHEAIDAEAPLEQIRIAALQALTRHRFFDETLLRATGDWEPLQQKAERDRLQKAFTAEHRADIRKLMTESGVEKVQEYLRQHVPGLPPGAEERASQPLGQLLKHVVHSIASASLRDRESEAASHWENQGDAYARDLEEKEKAKDLLKGGLPGWLKGPLELFGRLIGGAAEPGDNWVAHDEIMASDDVFEGNRRRILREEAQQLQLLIMILERRLKFGDAYSGLELINDQETIPWPTERPDWEGDDPERAQMITALEVLTGKSFRTDAEGR